MKKLSSQSRHDQIDVTVTLDHFQLTRNLVEKLAFRSYAGPEKKDDLDGQAMELTSIEAYVKGHLHVAEGDRSRRITFLSSYFFTCVKVNGSNEMHWAHSLS